MSSNKHQHTQHLLSNNINKINENKNVLVKTHRPSNLDANEHPFNDDISKNLERMLNKMHKSFDPFKLKDEHLKFSIVKEILECQRLLLTVNLSNNNNNEASRSSIGKLKSNKNRKSIGTKRELTMLEIYDEWKILAMVCDRVFFFFYLLALGLSFALFFIREQIYNDNG